jgi:hypothetical protein
MTKQRSEQLIVIALVVMLASTVGGGLAEGKTGEKYYGKKVVGGFLTILFSSLAAEVAPEAAALLAVSMASYAFFHYGLPAINHRYKKTTTKGKAPTAAEGVEAAAPALEAMVI